MARDTSIAVYHQIIAEGLLTKLKLQVYECLYEHGPLTQNETFVKLNLPKIKQDSIKPRFAELKELGVIKEVGKRPCRLTKREVYEWDVTSKLPKNDLLIKKSIKEKKEEILKDIAELGKKLPDEYKIKLRDIYIKIKKI